MATEKKVTIFELIMQMKDLASVALERLQTNMEALPKAQQEINAKIRQYQTEANEFTANLTNDRIKLAEIEKEKNLRTLYDYYKQGKISAEEYSAGVKAINKQAMEASADPSLFSKIKQNWLALSASIIAIWGAASQAIQYIDIGAKALQSEESFKQVTSAFEIDGDKLIAKMKEVSGGMIDESDLMQRAVKALQQGLNPDQIVSLLEVARSSARIAGIDVAAAFDRITEAAANQQVRGLKSLGIVIDQNKAFEDYANKIGIAKDALNEQQQSQALANAAIEEGQRQMSKLGPLLVNEAEQIQINKRAFQELKEEIGKNLISILKLAMEHIDGLVIALTAAGIANAPAAFSAITKALQSLSLAGAASSMAIRTGFAAVAAFLGYELGQTIDKLTYKLLNIDLSGLNKPLENIDRLTKSLSKSNDELAERLAELGFTGKDAWEKYENALKTGIVTTEAATGKQINLLDSIKQTITIMDAQMKALEATSKFQVALIKEDYEAGKITLEQYIAFVKTSQDKITENQIVAARMRIEETNKEYQAKKISADEMKAKIAVIEQEIVVIRQNAITEYHTFEQNALKEDAKMYETARKEEFDEWKNLQDLELQTFKAKLDLQNTYDEGAVQEGLLRQSDYLNRKLERDKEYAAKAISQAEETAQRILDASIGTELNKEEQKAYDDAIEKKKQLQLGLEKTIIESEQNILQAKRKAETEALNFYKACVEDTTKLTEQEAADRIAVLDAALKAGVLSYDKYREGVSAIEARITDTFKAELQERTKMLNEWAQIAQDRIRHTQEIIDTFSAAGFDDVKAYWGGYDRVISETTAQVIWEMQHLTYALNHATAETFWKASVFGRSMIQMAGMTIYEWMGKVRDYINYIKGLMASLQDTISSYRLQLMQLRGDRLGELDVWMQEETKKLEDQYKNELGKTQEYYDAKSLLDELYKEKKEKLLEEMKQNQEDLNASSGAAEGISPNVPASVKDYFQQLVPDFTQMMNNMPPQSQAAATANTQMSVNAEVKFDMRDRDGTVRWVEDELWPILKRKFELMGIKILNP